ncbi:CHC2 zinc finger domain-containing protein [Paraflavitalea speifideaquila]|uniref:CHC2 zinc finger domain-containing protein n=1 Tax=Paraflavitalea speifideaquila TaxID=3076558 RepID=UPI0028E85F5F|nr:CHC2 zinc finger domain-containing protein [Paraflavitalea speifideiaquila]
MEIIQLKQQLTITAVLQHYGLQPDKHQRLHCPFHPDKTPSLQIYPATNTFCCFSSNCTAGTGDAIQFIQLKENCTKHEALLKAAALAGGNGVAAAPAPAKLFIGQSQLLQSNMDKTALLTEVFGYYKSGLYRSKKAVDYLQSRSINYKLTEAAFNSGGLHVESRHQHLVQSMVQYGLLKPRPAGGYNVWARDCILFPLRDAAGNIVSLYGRSITNDKEQRHFYLQNRVGLYPHYPKAATTKLVLTESIIDAVNLLQQEGIVSEYAILALYGTNGLTDEHLQAIIGLKDLQEIIFMLNADEAGEAATVKHYNTLQQLLPPVTISKVALPAGEDINSVLCTHDDAGVLQSLLEERTESFLSIENKNQPSAETSTPPVPQHSKLNTTKPELLIYDAGELYIEILGGIRITGLDRMKVTLKILHKQKQLLPIRDTLDLYNRSQTEQLIQAACEHFDANIQQTAAIISGLTNELENYRIKRIESLQPRPEQLPEMTPAQRQAAISELKNRTCYSVPAR